ncbi:MAG: VOC family protein [Tumebacillaceae bacterium]
MHGIVTIEEVLFFVPNVSEAKSWYMGLLDANPTFDDPNYCAFRLGGVMIGLHPSDAKTAADVAGQIVYWRCANLDSTIAHFLAHGCAIFRGPIVGVDGPKICQVKDPFGNVWGLLEQRV